MARDSSGRCAGRTRWSCFLSDHELFAKQDDVTIAFQLDNSGHVQSAHWSQPAAGRNVSFNRMDDTRAILCWMKRRPSPKRLQDRDAVSRQRSGRAPASSSISATAGPTTSACHPLSPASMRAGSADRSVDPQGFGAFVAHLHRRRAEWRRSLLVTLFSRTPRRSLGY